MKNLEKIVNSESCCVPPFTLDNFQEEIRDHIHLEFFFQNCRFQITPQFGYLATGEVNPEEESSLLRILEEEQPRIEKLKEYLIYNLALYSALLETNSYYIELNGHLLIARFIQLENNPEIFEVKVYTIAQNDLPENYKDKIYLGRDFISLDTLKRPHFGIKNICTSMENQLRKLRQRFQKHISPEKNKEIEEEYISELEELLADFHQSIEEIEANIPEELALHADDTKLLLRANSMFREKKHALIEIEETIREMEHFLFEEDLSRVVKYATKFRKDITNYINYVAFKINGRLSDRLNNIHY